MINESNVEKYFWAEAINTSCYILNRVSIRKILNKTPYELWKNRKPDISYFHIFGCFCYILNDKENLGKFDSKSDKGIFLGYATNSKGYRIYNLKIQTMEISMHVVFDEFDDLVTNKEDDEDILKNQEVISNTDQVTSSQTPPKSYAETLYKSFPIVSHFIFLKHPNFLKIFKNKWKRFSKTEAYRL